MRMILRLLPLFPVLAVLGGSCDGPPPLLSTQINHISAAALVSCDAYPPTEGNPQNSLRTCMVIANPTQSFLRVFDLSERHFILSPIGYAPLAVRLDGLTTDLTTFEKIDPSLAFTFALDANSWSLAAINSLNSTLPSFSSVEALPKFNLSLRPLAIYGAPDGQGNARILTTFFDGSIQLVSFDTQKTEFGEAVSLNPSASPIVDSDYDAATELLAQVDENNSVLVSKIGVDPMSFPEITNDGPVKVAIGQFRSSSEGLYEGMAPHLLIMRQDTNTLRTIRLNVAGKSFDDDKTITLASRVTVAYIPEGENKSTCCNGASDWVSVGSLGGGIFHLTSSQLLSEDTKDYMGFDAAKVVGGFGLIQILGAEVLALGGQNPAPGGNSCSRKMFFVFSSGAVSSACEGSLGVTPVFLRDALGAK